MIEYLDNLLRHLFIAQIDEITDETQVCFRPPDAEWHTYVTDLKNKERDPVNALNIYLLDLHENSKLRSNARIREVQNGTVTETPVPRRIDCHYLISAWSPAKITPAVEPMVDEHALLYKVIGVLMNSVPLIPRKIYEHGTLPGAWSEIADMELPTEVLPGEGFPKLDEFWGTMEQRWRPAVYLIVTLPVFLEKPKPEPMVTTRITEYRFRGKPETAETWIQIAGTVTEIVTDPNGNLVAKPIAEAWVRLETLAGAPLQTTYTKKEEKERGRYTFSGLQKGEYKLRVRAPGFEEWGPEKITLPSANGNYNVQLKLKPK